MPLHLKIAGKWLGEEVFTLVFFSIAMYMLLLLCPPVGVIFLIPGCLVMFPLCYGLGISNSCVIIVGFWLVGIYAMRLMHFWIRRPFTRYSLRA